jgi:hypothetical protein
MNCKVLLSGAIVLASAMLAQEAAPVATPAPAARGSFAWKGEETPFTGDKASFRAHVRLAVEAALGALGCEPAVGTSPDLHVVAHLARRDAEAPVAGLASLVIDLVDAKTGTLVWRSFDSDLSTAALAQATLARGKTYTWRDVPGRPGEEQPFTRTDRHVRNAMEAVMLFRDWTVATDPATADVYVAYRVTATGSAGKEPMTATLTVELSRRVASEVVWRGERTTKVPKPAKLEDAVIDAVVEIARDFREGRGSTAK